MLNIKTITNRQTLLDVAMQHSGSVEACFEIAAANGFGITSEPEAGTQAMITAQLNREIISLYDRENCKPASRDDAATAAELLPTGIGYMTIENNFKVY